MSKRSFFTAALVAAMIVLPGSVQTALAQNNDQNKKQDESAKSDSQASANQSQNSSANANSSNSASSSNSANQSQKQNQGQQAQSDDKAPAEGQNGPALNGSASSQSSASTQKGASQTSAQKNTQTTSTSRDSSNTSPQSTANRDSSRDAKNTQSSDRDDSASSDRSQSRDSSSDRSLLNNDRNRDRDSRDRGDNRDRHSRDFRNDFKFGKVTGRGITVSTITHGSIFYRSGLRDGDVIISYNGRPVRSQDDFYRVAVYQPGQRIPVVVLRDGREETIYVVYEDEVVQASSNRGAYFGAEFDQQSNNGAVIVRVDEGSPAAQAGLQQDDVVVALNGDRVNNGRDATDIINSMNDGQRVEVEFTRHARADVVLGGSQGTTRTTDSHVDRASHETSVAVGVDTDKTRRSDRSSSNYNSNSSRNRSDDRNNDRNTNRSSNQNRGGLLRGLRN